MDFNVKKFVKDAGSALSRVVQMTEEKLGTSGKTELDADFENLVQQADTIKIWTDKIVKNAEAVLTPNPGNRVEDYLMEKIDKKKPIRLSNLEYLGNDMVDSGNVFGSGTTYGSALIKVGQCEQRLGGMERQFVMSAHHGFVEPLHKFLDGEMKTVLKERNILESKRLDLDACKNRVRKARSLIGTTQNAAERDMRVAQQEFDRQLEITKLLLESVISSQSSHMRYLTELVQAQAEYYSQCHLRITELQNELMGVINGAATTANFQQVKTESPANVNSAGKRAKVVIDYDSRHPSELSLLAGEVILVENIEGESDEDFLIGQRGNQRGRVPIAFLEMIDE